MSHLDIFILSPFPISVNYITPKHLFSARQQNYLCQKVSPMNSPTCNCTHKWVRIWVTAPQHIGNRMCGKGTGAIFNTDKVFRSSSLEKCQKETWLPSFFFLHQCLEDDRMKYRKTDQETFILNGFWKWQWQTAEWGEGRLVSNF